MSSREVAILLVHEGNSPKSQWPLAKSAIIIGREVESDIQIDDRQVSRRHAEITRTKQGYMLRDLASKNGTFLNGEAVSQEPRLIRNGDSIGIALCGKWTCDEQDATAPITPGQPQKP